MKIKVKRILKKEVHNCCAISYYKNCNKSEKEK